MTFDDARTLLDVRPSDSPDAIRRAYLRKVKLYKPEQDPEGFRRVREAFDLLKAPAYFPIARASNAHDGTEYDAKAHGDDVFDAQDEPYGSTQGLVAPVPSPVVLEDVPSPIASFTDRYDEACERGESATALRAIAEEAVREMPDSADALWLLVDACQAANDTSGAIAALRRGIDAGFPGFVGTLAGTDLRALRTSDVELLLVETSAWARVRGAAALVSRGETTRAVDIVVAALDGAEREGTSPPPLYDLPHFGMRLVASGDGRSARRFTESLTRAMPALYGVVSAQETAIDFAMLRELIDLQGHADQDVLRIMARGMVGDTDMELALMAHAQTHGRDGQRVIAETAKVVETRAPTIANRYGPWLRNPGSSVGHKGFSPPTDFGAIMRVVVIFIMLARASSLFDCRDEPELPTMPPGTYQGVGAR